LYPDAGLPIEAHLPTSDPTLVGRTHAVGRFRHQRCPASTTSFKATTTTIDPALNQCRLLPATDPPIVAGYRRRATWLAGLIASFVATMRLSAIAVSGGVHDPPDLALTDRDPDRERVGHSSAAVATSASRRAPRPRRADLLSSPAPALPDGDERDHGEAFSELTGYAGLAFQSMASAP
jgi:hypothetical protein